MGDEVQFDLPEAVTPCAIFPSLRRPVCGEEQTREAGRGDVRVTFIPIVRLTRMGLCPSRSVAGSAVLLATGLAALRVPAP